MIEFVSYDGEYPNLCRGTLKLKIDNQLWIFDDYYKTPIVDDDGNMHSSKFWSTGGCAGVNFDDYSSYCTSGPWELDESEIPEQLKKYAKKLIEVFNDNVKWGCCGGCI